jgi:hypothetical protein
MQFHLDAAKLVAKPPKPTSNAFCMKEAGVNPLRIFVFATWTYSESRYFPAFANMDIFSSAANLVMANMSIFRKPLFSGCCEYGHIQKCSELDHGEYGHIRFA